MISYIKGMLVEKEEDRIVVEAGSIGYDIYVPLSFLASLPPVGEEVQVYTYLQVREDAVTLYGFPGRQDLKMFRQLLGVTGIGPRGALGILSALQPDQLFEPAVGRRRNHIASILLTSYSYSEMLFCIASASSMS